MREGRRLLLVELNEITWDLIDRFIDSGKLPTFSMLKEGGSWAAPVSVDLHPQMDPWITWTTVYSGVPQEVHGVFHLEQPPGSIKAKRIWEICKENGLGVGVYGSLCSYPPVQVKGFYVPDTFSPEPDTYPEELRLVQELNLRYTRANRIDKQDSGILATSAVGFKLLQLGLRPGTAFALAKQLVMERFGTAGHWRRVALQPVVNFDVFSRSYKRYKPEFASFHTNHVAHYQHTYWRAMEPEIFAEETSDSERLEYCGAIEHGYEIADALLARAVSLCDENTVLAVASSMGQKPYHSTLEDGKAICQVRSLPRLMEGLQIQDVRSTSVMSDQFNIYPRSRKESESISHRFRSAYVDEPGKPVFQVSELDGFLTVNIVPQVRLNNGSVIVFPSDDGVVEFLYDDLILRTGLTKSGCHDPKGMLMLYGNGIKAGNFIEKVDNLDLAPTFLKLLGIDVPAELPGRVLTEAFSE